jgi:PAS domain S-box-containing protein
LIDLTESVSLQLFSLQEMIIQLMRTGCSDFEEKYSEVLSSLSKCCSISGIRVSSEIISFSSALPHDQEQLYEKSFSYQEEQYPFQFYFYSSKELFDSDLEYAKKLIPALATALSCFIERKRRDILCSISSLLHSNSNPLKALEEILDNVRIWMGCKAVSLRAQSGEDFPFYASSGFTKGFLQSESSLLCPQANSLQCVCGLVLNQNRSIFSDYYEEDGVFFCNALSLLAEEASENDAVYGFRYKCLNEGFKSVIFVPVFDSSGASLGLLQLFGAKENYFNGFDLNYARELRGALGCVLHRLSEKKRLARSEAKYRALVEHSPDVIASFDPKFRLVYVSPNVSTLFGVTQAELLGKTYEQTDCFSSGFCSFWRDKLKRVFSGKEALDGCYVFHGDNKETTLHWRMVPVKDDNQTVIKVIAIYQDITKERNLERDYRLLFNSMQDGFAVHEMIYDAHGNPVDYRFLSMNSAFEKIMGLPSEQMQGKTVLDLLPQVDEEWLLRYEEVTRTGIAQRFEKYSSELGRYFEVVSFSPVKGRFACIVQDITERKELSARLEASENLHRAILDSSPMQVFIFFEERCIYANSSAVSSLGYSNSFELICKNLEDLISEKMIAPVRKWMASGARHNSHENFHMNFLKESGGLLPVEAVCSSLNLPEGEAVLIMARDLSAQLIAEQAQYETEKRLDNILSTFISGVQEISPDGRLLYINPGYCKMFGVTEEDVLGKYVWDAPAIQNRQELKNLILEIVENEPEPFTWMGDSADSSGRKIKIRVDWNYNREKDGRIAGLVAVITDVTESHLLEERLKQTEKMEAVGKLAGGVAHDFNNQLSVIMGYADLLHQTITDKKQKHSIESILMAARRSADLTGKLLAFSRKGKYQRVFVNVSEILEDVTEILKRSIGKNIRLTCSIFSQLYEKKVLGDPTQIQNAFLNICLNARDAMPDGGNLEISLTLKDIDQQSCERESFSIFPGEYLCISFKDSGFGIAPEILSRIFEPFFTTKEEGKGTGLGLAAVYGTVKNHGGFVTAESHVGDGTVMKVFLPSAESSSVETVEEKKSSPQLQSGKVLVIDDEPFVGEFISSMLETLGCEPVFFASCSEAISEFQKNYSSYDLIMLDMLMPEMSGKDVFFALRAIHPEAKVLLCSGYTDQGDSRILLESGACGFLQKPFELRELSGVLSKYL